jgi:hypothetical protein
METIRQGRLYRLAKRLSLGRLLRYGALWARYGVRRGQSVLLSRKSQAPGARVAAEATVLARTDLGDAKRMVVASWFPLDLANARLHRALLASVAKARLDLGVTPEILDCVEGLKAADDLTATVDAIGRAGRASPDHQHGPLHASPPAPACPLRNASDRRASSSSRPDRDPVRRRISEARPQDGSRLTRGPDALHRRRQYAQGRLAHRDPAGGPVA